MSEAPAGSRADYRHFHAITTRWLDNDAYGHVNNAIYYGWFDTAVNAVLIARGLLDVAAGPAINLVVESGCRYSRAVVFPETVEAGLRIAKLGTSSVRWEIGLFTVGHDSAAAQGHFVHVHVDRTTRKPQPMPPLFRERLADLIA
ncbi:thioesterase family protein [Sandarakinorhabdus sp.]|uniref:acyl-CoA thioesterase n=1 Tax=Sandarakinorhabdus sp. TaxID=1916663 RepID=UPI00286EABAD|nr:thioesterase family protein [Sandarakinorhabdus sp.]